jgi:hypothetical protein
VYDANLNLSNCNAEKFNTRSNQNLNKEDCELCIFAYNLSVNSLKYIVNSLNYLSCISLT